jgi:hypothetical protein
MPYGCFGDEQRTEHIDVEALVKGLFGDLVQRCELIDPGVVDNYIQAAVIRKSRIDQAPRIGILRHVSLNGNRRATSSEDVRNHFLRAFFAAGVIYDYGRPSSSKGFRNSCADALRGTCNDCHFASQLAHFLASNIQNVALEWAHHPSLSNNKCRA